MADRIFIVPLRNDLSGLGLSLTDLKPNAGQKNSIYDGAHQNVYLSESLDQPGTTVVSGITYLSGPLNTTLTANAVADDSTGGGNDVNAMQATSFGLASYFKDRVHRGGIAVAANGELTFAECNTVASLVLADALAGTTLDLTRINVHLAATVANTDLTGASGNSKSFGAVEDIMRILSGEVYRLPVLTIIENVAGQFRNLAERQAFVAAQTAAMVAAQGQFYASGGFLAASDAGYRPRQALVRSGALNLSIQSGVLSHYMASMNVLNSNSYAYTAGEVSVWKPRAVNLVGTAINTVGAGPLVAVYDSAGNSL